MIFGSIAITTNLTITKIQRVSRAIRRNPYRVGRYTKKPVSLCRLRVSDSGAIFTDGPLGGYGSSIRLNRKSMHPHQMFVFPSHAGVHS
jgi:hypothetical protein